MLTMVMALVLSSVAGCSSEPEDTTEAKVAATTAKAKSDDSAKADDTTATEEADMGMEHVDLTWYYIGSEQPDEEAVFAAANEIIGSEINATVEFIRLGWGDYEQKMQLMDAAGETYDLGFSAGWINNYKNNVEAGAYLQIDDMLYEYAPKTMELIPAKVVDGTRIGGHVYGIPGYQVSFRQMALIFNKELVDKYDMKDAVMSMTSLDELTPLLQTIKDNEPGIIPTGMDNFLDRFEPATKDNYLHMVMDDFPVYMNYDLEVLSSLDAEQNAMDMKVFARAADWMQKGFYHPDAGMGNADMEAEKSAAKFFVISDVSKPGVEADMLQRYGYDVYAVPMGMSTISTGSVTSNMTVISRTSENPERAIMLLELMNTNVELYNIIVFGLEGQHYAMAGEDRVEVTNADGYSGMAWMMGSQFNAYKLPSQADDVWDVTIKLNDEALSSPDLGFYFDDSSVKTEFANVSAVYAEYKDILMFGILPDYEAMINERNAKLEKAGIQKVVDEMQAQINAWK